MGGWYKEERYAFWNAQRNTISGEYENNRPRKLFTIQKGK